MLIELDKVDVCHKQSVISDVFVNFQIHVHLVMYNPTDYFTLIRDLWSMNIWRSLPI